jgi:hypothetical protein
MLVYKTVPFEQTDGRRYSTLLTPSIIAEVETDVELVQLVLQISSVTSTWILKRFDLPQL